MKLLKNQKRFHRQLFIVAGFLVLVVSCRKTEGDLGLNVLPESDKLNIQYMDNFTLNMRTVKEEPVRTDELSNNMLGSYQDPVFGKKNKLYLYTSASFRH